MIYLKNHFNKIIFNESYEIEIRTNKMQKNKKQEPNSAIESVFSVSQVTASHWPVRISPDENLVWIMWQHSVQKVGSIFLLVLRLLIKQAKGLSKRPPKRLLKNAD